MSLAWLWRAPLVLSFCGVLDASCIHLQRVCVVVEVLTAVVLWTILPISGVRQWLSTPSPEQTHGQVEVGHSSTCHTSRNIM